MVCVDVQELSFSNQPPNLISTEKFSIAKMEKQHILKIAMEYRGRYKKGSTIFNASEASLQQKFCLKNKNVFF